MSVKMQLDRSSREQIGEYLAQILANTYLLYVKTQNFHWNVIDPRFYSLHRLLEKEYEDLAEAVDTIAERIRTLRVKAPGSMREFLELGSIEEAEGNLDGNQMLQQLIQGHEIVAAQIRPRIEESQKLGDEGTADMLIQRLKDHEKTAWMLRSHFEE